MAKVRAQKVTRPDRDIKKRDLYATLCYYYPQYTLRQAASLPARDVELLIKTAQKIEAGKLYNLTMIAAAPHSKNGKGVKELAENFRKIMENE